MTITPGVITIPPRRPFEFTCTAPEGSTPSITIPAEPSTNVEVDQRFSVTRTRPNAVTVRARYGLAEANNGMVFL